MTAAIRASTVVSIAIALLVAGCGDEPPAPPKPVPTTFVAADRELHAAVDAYEAAAARGTPSNADRGRLTLACWRWPQVARQCGYEPNNAIMASREIAYAGTFAYSDGIEQSVVVGTGQTGMVVSVWLRAPRRRPSRCRRRGSTRTSRSSRMAASNRFTSATRSDRRSIV